MVEASSSSAAIWHSSLPRQILSGEGREVLNGENGGRREMTQTKKIWEMIRYIVLYALSAIKKRNI